jgi:alkylated DNA nucleotide flippase Atl1
MVKRRSEGARYVGSVLRELSKLPDIHVKRVVKRYGSISNGH